MDRLTHLQNMTHEELVNRVMDLEKTDKNTVYSIDREDVAYALMTMTSVPEAFITEELIDEAQQKMHLRFTFTEENGQITDFLDAQNVNWATVHGDYSGRVDNDGNVLIYFSEQVTDDEPDIVLTGNEQTEAFFEHIRGEGWQESIEESPYFSFNRAQLSGFDYQG